MNGFAPYKHTGVALMTMIFILVVMGSAVVFMARLSSTQNMTTNLAVQSARAKYAAMAGIYWAAYHINWLTDSGGLPAEPDDTQDCPASVGTPEVINNLDGGLAGFTVTVTCDREQYTEGSNTIYLFNVVSTAEYGSLGDPNYAYKQVSVVMERQE